MLAASDSEIVALTVKMLRETPPGGGFARYVGKEYYVPTVPLEGRSAGLDVKRIPLGDQADAVNPMSFQFDAKRSAIWFIHMDKGPSLDSITDVLWRYSIADGTIETNAMPFLTGTARIVGFDVSEGGGFITAKAGYIDSNFDQFEWGLVEVELDEGGAPKGPWRAIADGSIQTLTGSIVGRIGSDVYFLAKNKPAKGASQLRRLRIDGDR